MSSSPDIVVRSGVYKCTRATTLSAGYDLRSSEDFTVEHGSVVVVPTGVYLRLPYRICGMVCSRSGLATKGIMVVNAPGIIDPDYENEVKVLLTKVTPGAMAFSAGDRIAQLLFVEWHCAMDSPESKRAGGFGSTGIL